MPSTPFARWSPHMPSSSDLGARHAQPSSSKTERHFTTPSRYFPHFCLFLCLDKAPAPPRERQSVSCGELREYYMLSGGGGWGNEW